MLLSSFCIKLIFIFIFTYVLMSHANFRSKRVFGQPHKIFRETNLYLQLMCLETDKVRAWRAFALLKGNL